MKIFIDSAVVSDVAEAASWGIIDGVTTNPTLAAKAGQDYETALREISALVAGPISAEVIGSTKSEMIDEARQLAQIAEN
ncbi:MAG TPA: fructose-6-phosphate aldolase, partial [Actinobacteria bacterium]|nr:fructose-6-phosphate aldolase [Actinomycetota bacterium]